MVNLQSLGYVFRLVDEQHLTPHSEYSRLVAGAG